MAFDDLDLEFEDEDEAKKKKGNEALHTDVDLEFHTHEEVSKPVAAARPTPVKPVQQQARPTAVPGAVVKKIDEARPGTSTAIKRPLPSIPTPRSVGSSALKEEPDFEVESQEVIELREKVRRVEIESEIRVGIAEFKTEYVTEVMSDMKLLDHQVNQLLVRINAKHPDMKQEVLMIKKLLADFTSKKRK